MPDYKPKSKNPHYRTDAPLAKEQPEQLEPCVKFVVEDCWDKWDAHWSSRFNDFEKYYDRWIGMPPKRDEEWQSQFHKRLTWQAEKILVARFFSALWPTPAPIEEDATETVDELQGILAKSMIAHWFKIGMFSKEFLSAMRSAGIYGTGLFEDEWFQKVERQPRKLQEQIPDFRKMVDQAGLPVLDEMGNIRAEQIGTKTIFKTDWKNEVVEDRYRVRKTNIFSWRVHPHKLDDDDDYPVIKQEYVTYKDLLKAEERAVRQGFKKFDNLEKIKEDRFSAKEEDVRRLEKGGDFVDRKNPRIELLHYWGYYKNGDEAEEKKSWVTVANRKYKLRLQDNPFWHQKSPLFHIVWTEDEKPSYYGIGIAQIGSDAEDRANTVVNIRTDVKKKNVRGTGRWNANDKKIKKLELNSNAPGVWRACSDINTAYAYDNPPQLSPDDYKEEEVAVNDHREITGASSVLMPAESPRQRPDTLGGMQQELSQALAKLKPDLSMMERMGIRQMANRGFLLTMQFMTKPEAIKLVASSDQRKQFHLDEIYKYSPSDIINKVNFHATGLTETLDKLQNIDKLLKFAETTGKIPPMQQITNYQSILKRVALWLGFEDVEDFVLMNPVNPLQPMQPAQAGIPTQGQGMPGLPPGVMPGQEQMPGGLPPELLQMIVQQMGQGANAPIFNRPITQ